MIDIKRIRTEPDVVKGALARRGIDLSEVDEAIKIDIEVRDLIGRRDETRAKVKELSSQVGAAHKSGDKATAEKLTAESKALGEQESQLEAETADLESQLRDLLLVIPNIPFEGAPDGKGEEDNPVVDGPHGKVDGFADYQKIPHWETAEALGILDLERGAKISGSMFAVFRGAGATMARAICQLALDRNADVYEEIRPPTLVRTSTLEATGQLPKFADDAYVIERDDLWTIPTAEVPLTSLYKDEIIDEAQLPMNFMAYSPCLRREAGSAGKDTRGLLRVHEFDKVELLSLSTPEQAPQQLEQILSRAVALVESLGLTYRVIEICTGDLGQSHHRSFDVEVYSPGVDKWLEVSSCSWFSDYQARRANVRYRPTEGKGNEMVNTCNGSALAVPRIWAAIVETYRQPDGTVNVPEVLAPYMRGITSIK